MDDLSREELISQLKEVRAALSEMRQLLETVVAENKLLKRSLYGNRRERYEDPRQQSLFDSEWIGQDESNPSEADHDRDESALGGTEDESQATRKRRSRGRLVFPDTLPRKQVVHELKDEDLPEELRGREDVRRFQKKVGEFVEVEPATAYVVEEFVEVVAADQEDESTQMASATRPARVLDCYAGPGLLASMVVDRFADFLPYYRLEERLKRLQLNIPRGTIARWMIRLANQLKPLIDKIRSRVMESSVICMDETPVKLLEPGRGEALTSYLWTTVGDEEHPYNGFYFTVDRSRAGPEEILKDYRGVLVSDAYVCYESLQAEWSDRMRWACCHVHARRKFEELDHLGSTQATATALGYFQRLFALEDQLREVSAEERYAARNQHAKPLMSDFKKWLDDQRSVLRPKHPLRGAIQYMTKRWQSFIRFLENGSIPVENNAAERSVKLPVLAKKNHLFFASREGGEAAMAFYTLTATCRRLHIDPFAYIHHLFQQWPRIDQQKDLSRFLPDQWLADHPQHRLEIREEEAKSRSATKKSKRSQRRKALARKLKRK